MIIGLDLDSCPYCGYNTVIVDKLKHTLKCRRCKKKFTYDVRGDPKIVDDGFAVYVFNEQLKQ